MAQDEVRVAWGALAGLHNSPIAITVPAKHRRPLLLDMANSIVAAIDIAALTDVQDYRAHVDGLIDRLPAGL